MPGKAVVYRERLVALGAPGGPVFGHMVALTARIDTAAKRKLENDMVGKITGNLLSSQAPPTVTLLGERVSGILRNTASYAAAVHNGSRPHDIAAVNAQYLRFTPAGASQPIFRKVVHHPGTRGRPWLRTAAEEVTGRPVVL